MSGVSSQATSDDIKEPNRYIKPQKFDEPPSLEEISRNLTYYLHTIHNRLGALAGISLSRLVHIVLRFNVVYNVNRSKG